MADNHFSDLADLDTDRMHLGALLCGTSDLLYDRADEECIPADGLGHNMQGKLSMSHCRFLDFVQALQDRHERVYRNTARIARSINH